MRLTAEQIAAIKFLATECFGDHAIVYLFGSRADQSRRGGDIDLLAFSANVFADMRTESGITPYLGGGIGVVKSDVDKPTKSTTSEFKVSRNISGHKSTDLTAFGEVGIAFPVFGIVEIVPGYRYQWINNAESAIDEEGVIDDVAGGIDDVTAHIFKVGFRYSF